MYSSENEIDLLVTAAAISPTFDNPLIVSEDSERTRSWRYEKDGANQELEAYRFRPADISTF
ncbi:hypothetical protein EW026_g1890 [Hermanssonia centrifuga]|uniref:Uncharacterized protein n=1 Tax=Hermanssonia centrifuga TaxID=98765 RepID=A0A4S4KQ13_9APHY|nr:hypothetical protein EW026_g1890 [Hermanssonia centrifuga]